MTASVPTIGIFGAGAMGSAVGRRLAENGAFVLSVLDGRSPASVERARAAGMRNASLSEMAEADIVLSIVPPKEAVPVAEAFAAVLPGTMRPPIFVECNAISPTSARAIAASLARADCSIVDGGIIGGPPKPGAAGPVLYLSGAAAQAIAERLNALGLECRVIEGGIGAASALKMSYAGITKGLTALASVMILASERAGMGEVLRTELAASQPMLLAWFARQIPSMFDKAYRWVAEMEEIAAFVTEDEAGRGLLMSAARIYERLSADAAGKAEETGTLARFFKPDGL